MKLSVYLVVLVFCSLVSSSSTAQMRVLDASSTVMYNINADLTFTDRAGNLIGSFVGNVVKGPSGTRLGMVTSAGNIYSSIGKLGSISSLGAIHSVNGQLMGTIYKDGRFIAPSGELKATFDGFCSERIDYRLAVAAFLFFFRV